MHKGLHHRQARSQNRPNGVGVHMEILLIGSTEISCDAQNMLEARIIDPNGANQPVVKGEV